MIEVVQQTVYLEIDRDTFPDPLDRLVLAGKIPIALEEMLIVPKGRDCVRCGIAGVIGKFPSLWEAAAEAFIVALASELPAFETAGKLNRLGVGVT